MNTARRHQSVSFRSTTELTRGMKQVDANRLSKTGAKRSPSAILLIPQGVRVGRLIGMEMVSLQDCCAVWRFGTRPHTESTWRSGTLPTPQEQNTLHSTPSFLRGNCTHVQHFEEAQQAEWGTSHLTLTTAPLGLLIYRRGFFFGESWDSPALPTVGRSGTMPTPEPAKRPTINTRHFRRSDCSLHGVR
jgi:hypothetical protein